MRDRCGSGDHLSQLLRAGRRLSWADDGAPARRARRARRSAEPRSKTATRSPLEDAEWLRAVHAKWPGCDRRIFGHAPRARIGALAWHIEHRTALGRRSHRRRWRKTAVRIAGLLLRSSSRIYRHSCSILEAICIVWL